MQSGSGTKNPPWARSNVNNTMAGMNPQIMDPNIMSQQGMMGFQQQQVFNPNIMQAQGGMAMPMAGQMPMNQMAQGQMYPGNVVAYPTPRAMNPALYQNAQNTQNANSTDQRVFTGTVTKTHNDFGFVDHDVFYQTSVCAKGVIPKVNDRVLVEASYNPNMPFKWNATRVQVLPKGGLNQKPNNPKSNQYNAVPPPMNANKKSQPPRRDDRPAHRDDRDRDRERDRKRSRTRSRSRSRDVRSRRDSPPRKRPTVHAPSPVKYVVRVPRMPLDIQKLDVPGLSQRYTNLYIPSDFFNANVKWGETFPPQMPLSLNNPCAYHIMSKEVENPVPNDAVLEPPDADYRFSAKVMLISMPTLETLYQKCGLTKTDDKSRSKTPLHPTRLIKFLVGQKGKGGENFAIGGPWSPSLDGENPDTDPSVLVKTAIRTCKALTGIDLSSCAQWYRMVEFYYWREGSGGKSRLESVVLFLPDVWSAQPSRVEWTTVQEQYKAACEAAMKKLDGEPAESGSEQPQQPAAAAPAPPVVVDLNESADSSKIENVDDTTITIDENDDDEGKPEPTHYSKIELKTIKVEQLRQELRARNVSCKGLRAQLVSRLSKLLKTEEEKENKSEEIMELDDEESDQEKKQKTDTEANENKIEPEKKEPSEDKTEEKEDKETEKSEVKEKPEVKKSEKEIEDEKKKLERQKHSLKTRYELPSQPHLIVHPNTAAKGGKFGCNVATLSLLLDYRITDNKEHSFELFVFAEIFNEMLMRDFGFYIYKTLYTLPEKAEEVKEKDKSAEKSEKKEKEEKPEGEKKEDVKDEKKEEKDDKKKEEKDDKKKEEKDDKRKDDRRDERRESRRRERRDSHRSDSERSPSPRRRSRGVELPPDPYLLLSLVYFDTGRCGYVNRKDLQNLFMSLGLQLSRSQIRSILEKVCIKDTFSYRSLTQAIKDIASGSSPDIMQDMPLDTTVTNTEVPPHIAELEAAIATGNRNLLPVFNRDSDDSEGKSGETKDIGDNGMVRYKSRLVDVGALVAGAARAGEARARLEAALEAARRELRGARAAASAAGQQQRAAATQLADNAAALAAARARVTSLTASSKIFHTALKNIQSKVESVINIKYEDDDVIEVTNGPTKVEKEEKKEIEDVKEETTESKDVKETKVEDKGNVRTDSNKESDILASENMDLDDKE